MDREIAAKEIKAETIMICGKHLQPNVAEVNDHSLTIVYAGN